MPQRTLRRTPRTRIGGGRVQAILENIEVEGAEIFRAKILQGLHYLVEFVVLVIGTDLRLQLSRHGERITIDFEPLIDG